MADNHVNEIIQHLGRIVLRSNGAGLTDGQLLSRYIEARDENAFAALVKRHGPMVWGVCRRLLNQHDAEDAFQATFLVLVRKAATIIPREMIANWLYGVAYRTARRVKVTAAKRYRKEKQIVQMPEAAVDETDLWADLRPLLDQELSRLPDKYRAVIVLCDLEGKTRHQAAGQLRLAQGTVASRLTRARAMLAKRLARHGLTMSGGTLAALLTQNVASAVVPGPVVTFTIKAASAFAAGQATASGLISAKAVALAEGVLKTMFLTKLKIGAAVLLVLLAICIGVGTVAPGVVAQDPADKKTEAPKDTWEPAGVLEHKHAVLCVVFGPDQFLLASDEGVKLRAWDVGAKKEVPFNEGFDREDLEKEIDYTTVNKDHCMITAMTYAADNSWVSFRAKKGLHLAGPPSIEDGKAKGVGPGTGSGTSPLAIASDGKTYAIVGSDPNIVMMFTYEVDWDRNRAKTTHGAVCKGHEDEPLCAAFSPDNSLLVTGSADKTARTWDPTSGNEKHVLRGHMESIFVVAFSPDGKQIATGGKDGLVKLWDASTGKEQASLKGHSVVRCLAFSPDGKTLVSGGEDETVRIWDAKTGAEQAVSRDHKGTVFTVAFSRDGSLLASGGTDKTIRLWKKK